MHEDIKTLRKTLYYPWRIKDSERRTHTLVTDTVTLCSIIEARRGTHDAKPQEKRQCRTRKTPVKVLQRCI